MGTTYLELTNRVLRRINEVEIVDSDFATVRGIQAAAKDAVLDTVREINTQKFEWPFNTSMGSQLLSVGVEEYSWPTDLRIVDWESFYILKDTLLSINTTKLRLLNKDEWYYGAMNQDLDSETDGRGVPYYVFETNDGGFGVTPSPNEEYTLKFKYWIKTITLNIFSDICSIPTEYDHVITNGALRHMFLFLDNDERAQKADSDFKKSLDDMTYILIPKDKYAYDTRVSF